MWLVFVSWAKVRNILLAGGLASRSSEMERTSKISHSTRNSRGFPLRRVWQLHQFWREPPVLMSCETRRSRNLRGFEGSSCALFWIPSTNSCSWQTRFNEYLYAQSKRLSGCWRSIAATWAASTTECGSFLGVQNLLRKNAPELVDLLGEFVVKICELSWSHPHLLHWRLLSPSLHKKPPNPEGRQDAVASPCCACCEFPSQASGRRVEPEKIDEKKAC